MEERVRRMEACILEGRREDVWEPTQQQQKSWTARRRTRLDVGYDLDTRSVEERDHTLEIRISGFVHVEYIAIAVVADRVA